jgi:hypothetical protein
MNDTQTESTNQATSADINSPISGQPLYGYLPLASPAPSEFEDFGRTILAVPRSEADEAEAKRPKRNGSKP